MKNIILTFIVSVTAVCITNAQTYNNTISATECENYTWRGTTYTSSGIYYDTITFAKDTTFDFTGSDQSFTVPDSITDLNVELYGAGGGSSSNGYSNADGGSGAYVNGNITVTPGTLIKVIVGEGGATGIAFMGTGVNYPTYGGGTAGTYINNGSYGGAGGGRTAIQIGVTDIVSAGGGGGAGAISYVPTNGGDGGSGSGPSAGGSGGSSTDRGEGGISYLTDPLFNLGVTNIGGANNAGSGSTNNVDGGNGQARISWTSDSVYILNLTINNIDATTTITGTTVTSNATNTSYQWVDCDNSNTPISEATNQSFTATVNGNYAVIVDNGDCSDTSECVAVNTVGLNENAVHTEIRIFPNPTNDQVTVAIDNAQKKEYTLKVTDATGRELSKHKVTGNATQINLSNYGSGVYFIQVLSKSAQSIHRVIKK